MALRALMLKKHIDEVRKALAEIETRKAELVTREAELEQSIAEAETDEEKAAVEEAVTQFEADKAEIEAEEAKLNEELEKIETELSDEEAKQATATPAAPAEDNRAKEKKIIMRKKFFGMNMEERTAFLENEEVKSFLERTRKFGKEQRSVSGADLLIPTVVLSLIRENIAEYSKLIGKVNLQSVPGKARQSVMGLIPEAVWTEMCGKLNELNLAFTGVEVDGYKVGGFIPVCNAVLEDSDENLAAVIIEALGKAIGYALDKAIVFGTGTKMPLGIFTRLAQTVDPSDDRTTIPWKDLHTSNIVSITTATKGAAFFTKLLENSGIADGTYARNGLVWIMNKKTANKVLAESLAFNAAGSIVASAQGTMPVVGGEIVELNFMPDDVIVAGYGELYLLAERAGAQLAQSSEVRFIEDQTVFKGTARYDGVPVIAEAFVAIGVNGTTPSASGISFAADTANP